MCGAIKTVTFFCTSETGQSNLEAEKGMKGGQGGGREEKVRGCKGGGGAARASST